VRRLKIKQNHEISQKDGILVKNLYLSKWCGARRLLHEFPDQGWKLDSIDSLLKTVCKTGTIVWQPGSGRPCSVRSSGGTRAQSGGQAKKAPISSWDFVWNYHSLFKCAQDNSLQSPAQMLQTTACSAVVWSQSHLPSLALINNLIVCYKSCYCSILNRKLCNK